MQPLPLFFFKFNLKSQHGQHLNNSDIKKQARMSCQFGWGCESEDANSLSMNKIQAAENSHLKDHAASTNTFIVYMRVSKSLVDTCNTGHAQKFKIDSDYEPSSAIQVVQLLHNRSLLLRLLDCALLTRQTAKYLRDNPLSVLSLLQSDFKNKQ